MSRSLKLYIAWLVSFSAVALLLTSYLFADDYFVGIRPDIAPTWTSSSELNVVLGLAFWIVITLFAGALPVRMPRGTFVSVSIAPVITAMVLGGPVAGGWVALIGTTEFRELRGDVPWYGTAANLAPRPWTGRASSGCATVANGPHPPSPSPSHPTMGPLPHGRGRGGGSLLPSPAHRERMSALRAATIVLRTTSRPIVAPRSGWG